MDGKSREAFGPVAKKLEDRLKAVNLAIAPVLEEESPYLLGEVGTDTAVDKNQQVKIIEVNYKPNWTIFNDFPETQEQLCRHFLNFCQSLAGSWYE